MVIINYYKEIKEELVNNEITKRVKDYSKNRSDLNTYYNVGKLLSKAGKHYGEGIIKEYSIKLTSELGKGYSERNLRNIRQFYKISEKWQTLSARLSWSHYCEIIWFNNINEINYYIRITEQQNLSVRQLRERIKNKEYERLDDKTKEKLITSDGNLCRDKSASCSDDEKIKIEMNGTKPSSGKITITNGTVDQSSSNMTIGNYDVTYNSTKKTYEAAEKGSSTTTVVYRWSTDEINIGDTINPSDTSNFTKDASTLGKVVYLKHILDKDHKVTESYACAILNNKEYCLRGGDSSSYGWSENVNDYTGNTLILKQIENEKIEGISCDFFESDSYCSNDSASFYVTSYGAINAFNASVSCMIEDNGSSNCASY